MKHNDAAFNEGVQQGAVIRGMIIPDSFYILPNSAY